MTISICFKLLRPADLCGLQNNLRVLDVLSEKLDGVCMPTSIALDDSSHREVGLLAQFQREDDPMEEPMVDKDEACEWALNRFTKDLDWAIAAVTVDTFEPDEPGCSERETKAMRSLGTRPFSEWSHT